MDRPTRYLLFTVGISLFLGIMGWSSAHILLSRPTPKPDTSTSISSASAPTIQDTAQEMGLFFVSETPEAWYEAPVLKSEVRLEVHGLLVQTTVRQHFFNPSNQWLEGIYVFPLPEQSAVDRLRMQVGDRFIEGAIKEQQEARRSYERAKREGKRASLISSARANVFSTRVANVGPGEEVIVEIRYRDAVRYRDHRYSLRVPMVVAPRYVPGQPIRDDEGDELGTTEVPDAGEILAPLADPAQGPIDPVTLTVRLDPGFEPRQITSLYHPVDIETQADGARVIRLADGPVPANRDFVLEWRAPQGEEPTVSLFAEHEGTDTYLYGVVYPPESPAKTPSPRPRDLVLVVDVSGSMAGTSIGQVKEALRFILSRLHSQDRFNLITFESTTAQLFHGVRPATVDNLATALRFVRDLEANGGTEILPAITLALSEKPDRERLRQIVVLTDGAIGYESQVLETIHRRLGTQRLFTIGIGSAPNGYFMREAAEIGRGTFTYIGDTTETKDRLLALFAKLEHPVVTNLSIDWHGPAEQAAAWHEGERLPDPLPDLYRGEPVTFTVRVPNLTEDRLNGTLNITGSEGATSWRRELPVNGIKTAQGVAKLWARRKVAQILREKTRGNLTAREARARVVAMGLQYHLVTQFTSLVAIDKERARPSDAALATHRLPLAPPAGWDFEPILGEDSHTPLTPDHKHNALPPPHIMRLVKRPALVALALPQTATSAQIHLLIGWILLMVTWAGYFLSRTQAAARPLHHPTANAGERQP